MNFKKSASTQLPKFLPDSIPKQNLGCVYQLNWKYLVKSSSILNNQIRKIFQWPQLDTPHVFLQP